MHAVPSSWELVGSPSGADPEPVAPPLTEFTLTSSNPPQQTNIQHGNPLCAIAAQTRAGMGVCNHGCGICNAAPGAVHTCPFGLEMHCTEVTPAGSKWVGRRFSTVNAMHQALELLELNGVQRDDILMSLPDEPVVPRMRMRIKTIAEKPATAPTASADNEHAGHILEYVEQVHRLISSAGKRDEVCNRFLRALCGAVPFDEMAIYLADGEELVLAATANRDDKKGPRLTAHPCKPAPDGLVAQAAARRCTLIEATGGVMEPLAGNGDHPAAIAIPLAGKTRSLGVWVARCSGTPFSSPIRLQPIRLMHLLADLLAGRLEHESAAAGGVEVVPIVDPNHKLMADLRAEVARATRMEGAFALLRVTVDDGSSQGRAKVRLPLEEFGESLVGAVRPYDRVAPCHGEANAWWVMGAHAAADEARSIAARLVATLEDVMDAHGGAEELGISFRVGISVWGDDAATADELVAHATAATTEAYIDPISQYRPPCLVMDDHG